jgi:hypothetical protein
LVAGRAGTIELQYRTIVIGDDALMGSDRSDPNTPWNRNR